jgi:hypothetical protein
MGEPHHLVIDGRRWRRSDPGIPDPLRSELVHELMRARRSVGAAKRAGDSRAERLAREHVQDAKVALGERGRAWWEPESAATLRPRIEAATRALLRHRGPEKTICPSDVARIVGGDAWRKRMQVVRDTTLALVESGELEVRQKGKVVAPVQLRGPIRLALRVAAASQESPKSASKTRTSRIRR